MHVYVGSSQFDGIKVILITGDETATAKVGIIVIKKGKYLSFII